MAQLYLLPCGSCNKQIEVELKQAGSEISCPKCQATIHIPTMGGIKQLELSNASGIMVDQKASSPKGRHIGPKQWLFSGGLVVLVLAAIAGFAIWFYADSLVTISDIDQTVQNANEPLTKISPAGVWDAWDQMFAKGPLPEWKETEEMGFNKQASYLKNIAYGFIGIAVLGFFALLSSLLMKDK